MRISDWSSDVCSSDLSFPRTSLLQIEAADDLQRSRQSLDQGNGTHVAVPSPIEPVIRAYPGPDATLTDRPCRFRGKVQSRAVDQPCLERQKYFCLSGTLAECVQFVQRNRQFVPIGRAHV